MVIATLLVLLLLGVVWVAVIWFAIHAIHAIRVALHRRQ